MILGYRGEFDKNYALTDPAGYPGEFKHIIRSQTYLNNAAETKKVVTVGVAGTGSGDQSITINGTTETVVYDTDGATTAPKLADALNSNPLISNVSVTVSGTDVVVTGLFPGDDFPISVSGDALTLTVTTAAGTAGDVLMGTVVVAGVTDDGFQIANASDRALGILGCSTIRESLDGNVASNFVIRRGEAGDVLEKGDAIALAETSFSPEDSVYYRTAGSGVIGAVANSVSI